MVNRQVTGSNSSWMQVLIWGSAHAINDGYPTLYLPLLPLLMLRWHFGVSQAGLLAGLLALTTQALQPFLGAWADRRGGPWFVVGGLLIGALGNALGLALSPAYWIFAIALMLGGLGNASFHPHMAALVSLRHKDHPGRNMSGWMVSGMLGHILAPLAVVALWKWGGAPSVAILAVPGLLAALALYPSAKTVPTPSRPEKRTKTKMNWKAWPAMWKRGGVFLGIVALRSMGSASLLTLLPIVWDHRGGSSAETGALLAVVYAGGMVGNLLGGSLSDALGPRLVLGGSLLGSGLAAALGGMATAGIGWPFWLAVGIWGFLVNGAGAVVIVYGQSLFPGNLGMASGLTMGLGSTMGAFGAWAVGAVAQWHGLSMAVDAAALCLILATVPVGWLRKPALQ
ncbi:MAG: MFS transporter [Firmicutes bacterium]|jgi:FSR family fosmidomycin resistance protein-like MFS transporter|nr:MFS transporter [Bacillota bacterium]MCL5013312.1 MFS transporter [Bacillota bacterium]